MSRDIGINKTYELIGQHYYWPRLFQEVTDYVGAYVICQAESKENETAPLEETDIPEYPFQKISMDISSPYGETSRGNLYIVSFVDWLTNWSDPYVIADKRAQTVAELILTEIFPRYGAPVQLVTDNGPENMNKIIRETLKSFNIGHITTSPYHFQSNAKITHNNGRHTSQIS